MAVDDEDLVGAWDYEPLGGLATAKDIAFEVTSERYDQVACHRVDSRDILTSRVKKFMPDTNCLPRISRNHVHQLQK